MRDQWEKSFAINVTAPLMLIEGFWESMRYSGQLVSGPRLHDELGLGGG